MCYENEEINRSTYDPCCCAGLCWAYLVVRGGYRQPYNFRNIDASGSITYRRDQPLASRA